MDHHELRDIAERYMELVNPTTPEKLLTIGKSLGLTENHSVIDFGCGYGEMLVLWAEAYGISGIGIDIRKRACERTKEKVSDRGLADRIDIICKNGAQYPFTIHAHDVAACIGASFIWGDFRDTISGMKDAVRPKGKLVLGEPYWLKENVPPEYRKENKNVHWEHELSTMAEEEGFAVTTRLKTTKEEFDRYESGNWYGLMRWIDENPDHPDWEEVTGFFHTIQGEYFRYGREFMGWALYVLEPLG